MNRDQAMKVFKTNFEKLAYTRGYAEVFNDFLDFALWMLHPTKDQKAYEEVKQVDKKYSKEAEAKYMAEMFNAWATASDNDGLGFYDALGDLFMECVSHGKNGQFFTPDTITDFMAAIVAADELQEGQAVNDCACGSGRMLLSAGKRNRNAKFYGADVDATCCKMTVLNLLVNTMCGEVAHMNTLTNQHWKSWHIKKFLTAENVWLPFYYTTSRGETNLIVPFSKTEEQPKPKVIFRDTEHKPNGVQASLF